MAQESHEGKEKISALLARFPHLVTYVPLRTEVRFEDFMTLPVGRTVYEIRPRAALDPFAEAKNAEAAIGGGTVLILMPGRKFDSSGTRLGQGGGWYDRFLSAVPKSWRRLGFCFEDQFIPEALPRQPWDEPMDYVAVASRDGSALTLYETKARPGMLAA
ncbi:MAG: 5-formyltetrahydrofolate cyclo-ligase [Patescibacteria group bacterium]